MYPGSASAPAEPTANPAGHDGDDTGEPTGLELAGLESAGLRTEVPSPQADGTEASEPEASEPEASEPEASEPEASEPEASEPEASEPEASEPEASEPEASDSDADDTADDDWSQGPVTDEPEPNEIENAPAALVPALIRRGFESLTEVQQAIADADDGRRDLRVSSQTGSGKTVAIGFALAGNVEDDARLGPTTLVIAPTRELATQVKDELTWLFADLPGVRCDVVTGGTSVQAEISRLRRRPHVLVATPGRLLDHLSSGALSVESVRQLVLDEADQMLDLGFKDELDGILEHVPEERRTHLVSATFPRAVRDLADRFQRDPLAIAGTALDAAHADIEHIAYRIGSREHYAALVNLLLMAGDDRTLVFVRTREDTVTLADRLYADGFSAMPLNGDLAQRQRTRTLDAFKRGSVRTLIATDVAARGLDIDSVTLVVHVHLPIDGPTYVHRSGRTGRAGNKGQSAMFVPKRAAGRAGYLYKQARVEPRWASVPGRDAVYDHKLTAAKAAVQKEIDGGHGIHPNLTAAARDVLGDRDPTEVVAVMLRQRMATTRAPFELDESPAPTERPRRNKADRPERVPFAQRETEHPRRGIDPRDTAGFTRFRINWGFRGGANPRRILAHVCRRGGVDNRMVGSIEMDSHGSTFLIDSSVAQQFAERVRTRDQRDPHLFITRDDGRDGGNRDGFERGRTGRFGGHRGHRR